MKITKIIVSTISGGLIMWITAGLWHNLILPNLNKNLEAHHKGLGLMLLAYLILAFLMTTIYAFKLKTSKPVVEGIKVGVILGILWVFPHGLAMAGSHDTSIIYEIKNAVYHIFEQGLGGIVIALTQSYTTMKKNY
jgi:hypothetical protein